MWDFGQIDKAEEFLKSKIYLKICRLYSIPYKRNIPENTGVGTTLQTPQIMDEIPVCLYSLYIYPVKGPY